MYTSARELVKEWKSLICRLLSISLSYADHNVYTEKVRIKANKNKKTKQQNKNKTNTKKYKK